MKVQRTRPGVGAGVGVGVEVGLDRRAPAPVVPLVLDADQQAVVDHRSGHLLVLAGPGTGKTATLAELVVARIRDAHEPLAPASILALTFGRRAARELADRISRRLAGGPLPIVSTFHSFAYGVLRQHSDPTAFTSPPRLLTAAEQDARVRELLAGAIGDGRLAWPESLSGAVGTLGIAEQVRALLARARGLGLDGRELARIGRRAGIPSWQAVGEFFEEYLDTLGFEGTLDYAELIHRAAVLAHEPRAGRALREAYRLVVVDEYQDTDPAQVALLRGLAAGGAQVVGVGDPDQSIYGFRGADLRGILRFPDVFADPSGSPARIIVLRTTRRFPQAIAAAAQGVLGPVTLAPLPTEVQRLHRSPVAVPGPARVEVLTFASQAAEAAGVAEALLRGHAGADGGSPLGWRQMAVLVRNPAIHGPRLARALRAAGIPVGAPPAERPLWGEPGVQALLGVVGLALDPGHQPEDAGRRLLGGPIGRLDAVAIRTLGRALLETRPEAGGVAGGVDGPGPDGAAAGGAPGRGSDGLLTAAACGGDDLPDGVRPAVVGGVTRVRSAVGAARQAIDESEMVGEVLWAAWTATDWPERLRATSLGVGADAQAAHRDLDALVMLFDLANRLPVHQKGAVGVAAFLDDVRALRLPVDGRTSPQPARDEVRLISAHRAKGLEWELVVVAGVQEGQWPDVRLRSDLLRVAELGPRGRVDPQSYADLLAEERRLMYVACTRARSSLVVTAVAEPVDGGLQPSRFLRELGVEVRSVPARTASPMSAEGLVVALREAACAPLRIGADGEPDAAVEALRGAAIQRLAALGARGAITAPGAPLGATDPGRWWWSRPVTGMADDADLVEVADDEDPAEPPVLSASAVSSLLRCPLQWFLDRRVGAGPLSGGAALVGSVVHAVAEALVRGDVPPDAEHLARYIDEIWASMPFPARYQKQRERARVGEMIDALLAWHAQNARAVVAAEHGFHVTVPCPGSHVALRGSIDRVEVDGDGRTHLVDFKTGRSAASAREAAEHPQLAVYQLAALSGALDGSPARLGGAELVHLGDRFTSGQPKVRVQAPLEGERTWAHDLVAEAARTAVGPRYPARPNGRCGTCPYRTLCPGSCSATPTPTTGGPHA